MGSSDQRVIGLLFAVMFASGTELLIMTPVLPQMAAELEVSVELAGLWVTAYVTATALFALIFGPISDHLGRRVVLRAGVAALSAGTLLCGLSTSFGAILAARAVSGAGAGMLVVSATSFVGDHFGAERRAEVMAHVMNGSFLALVLGVPIGAFLSSYLGWKVMFSIVAALLFGLLLVLSAWLPEPRAGKRTASLTGAGALRGYLALLGDPRTWGFYSMLATNGLSMTMYSVYLSPWMAEQFGFETHHRGLVYAVGGPAVLMGAPIAGRLAARFGRVPIVLAGTGLVGLMVTIMPWTRSAGRHLGAWIALDQPATLGAVPWPEAVPLVLCAFFVLIGGATRSGPLHTHALELVSSERRGSISALGNSLFQVGSALGATVGGLIWAAGPGRRFYVICVVAGALNLLAGAVLSTLTRRAHGSAVGSGAGTAPGSPGS